MKTYTNSNGIEVEVADNATIESGAYIESRAYIPCKVTIKKSDRIISISGFPNPITIINNRVCVGCSGLMTFDVLLAHTESYAKERGWNRTQYRTSREIIKSLEVQHD